MLVLALSMAAAGLLPGCRSPLPGLPGWGPPPPGEVHARLSAGGKGTAAGPLLAYLEPLDAGVSESAESAPATIRTQSADRPSRINTTAAVSNAPSRGRNT